MTQVEKRQYLISELLKETPEHMTISIPSGEAGQKKLLRSLLNIRPPDPVSKDFLAVQDEYLREEINKKGITDMDSLTPVLPDIYLWQGDTTSFRGKSETARKSDANRSKTIMKNRLSRSVLSSGWICRSWTMQEISSEKCCRRIRMKPILMITEFVP